MQSRDGSARAEDWENFVMMAARFGYRARAHEVAAINNQKI
jgi:hypothetical protein